MKKRSSGGGGGTMKQHFQTLSRHEVPREFQEEHVVLGFRPVNKPLFYYICTLFTMHNESVNVWTHLAPFFLILRLLVQVVREHVTQFVANNNNNRGDDTAAHKDARTMDSSEWWEVFVTCSDVDNRRTFYLFLLSCMAYLMGSTMAHLMHSASKKMHYLVFYFDFLAIAFYSLMSSIAFFVYSSSPLVYNSLRHFYVPVAFTLAIAVSYGCCYAKFKFTRPYPPEKKLYVCGTIGLAYIWNILPVFIRMVGGEETLQGNTYHYLHVCFFLVSVFFYASGWPQKSYPGKFDNWFHGHQIFHVFISITTWFQIKAIRYDMTHYLEPSDEEDSVRERSDLWSQVSLYVAAHLVISLLIVRYFYCRISNVLNSSAKHC